MKGFTFAPKALAVAVFCATSVVADLDPIVIKVRSIQPLLSMSILSLTSSHRAQSSSTKLMGHNCKAACCKSLQQLLTAGIQFHEGCGISG